LGSCNFVANPIQGTGGHRNTAPILTFVYVKEPGVPSESSTVLGENGHLLSYILEIPILPRVGPCPVAHNIAGVPPENGYAEENVEMRSH